MAQIEEVKAALVAVAKNIQEADDVRKKAIIELKYANTDRETTKWKAILESVSAKCNGLQRKEETLMEEKHLLIRLYASAYNTAQTSASSPDSQFKRQRIDDTIEKVTNYLFRTENWACVTIINTRNAVTYAHGDHSTLKAGDTFTIYSIRTNSKFVVKVVQVNSAVDCVLLEAETDLCQEEPKAGMTIDGRGYVQLGLSANQTDYPVTVSRGVISSSHVTKFGHISGSAGAQPSDSGGPCFDEVTCEFIGINLGCESVSIRTEQAAGSEIFEKITSEYPARARILSLISLQVYFKLILEREEQVSLANNVPATR
jgi:hypothetical protein